MLKVDALVNAVKKTANAKSLVIKKHSPEILTGAGIVLGAATVVTACTATLKVDDILDEHQSQVEKINMVKEDPEFANEYTEEDAVRDKAIVYIQTGVKVAKCYLPSITLGVLSVMCILSAHNIMSKRNVALMAAYKACEESLSNYREKVRERYGEDADTDIFYGLENKKIDTVEVDEETGKKKKSKKNVKVPAGQVVSQYARFFDELNDNWSKDPEQNRFFLQCAQNMMNDRLQAKGHVFLNEVYDILGLERSSAGQIVGWIRDSDEGDNYIDFNIFDGNDEVKREFVNGYNPSILLDFNVDGVIYDLI